MPILTDFLLLKTNGNNELTDITSYVEHFVTQNDLAQGMLTVSVVGSTSSIICMEFEPGLIKDFPLILDKFIPRNDKYFHDKKWDDDNAYALMRSSLLGNSKSFVVYKGELQLASWQQIVLADFDNKHRVRKIIFQFLS